MWRRTKLNWKSKRWSKKSVTFVFLLCHSSPRSLMMWLRLIMTISHLFLVQKTEASFVQVSTHSCGMVSLLYLVLSLVFLSNWCWAPSFSVWLLYVGFGSIQFKLFSFCWLIGNKCWILPIEWEKPGLRVTPGPKVKISATDSWDLAVVCDFLPPLHDWPLMAVWTISFFSSRFWLYICTL